MGIFQPTNNDQVGNIATVNWSNVPAGSRTTNKSVNDNAIVDINQPLLLTTKTITSSGPYGVGSTVDYQVIITNTGQSTAYDITWEDILPSQLNGATLVSITHSNNGVLTENIYYSKDFTSNSLVINFDGGTTDTNLAPGESLTILYSVNVGAEMGAGSTLTNTADVDWSSKDGVVSGERIYDDSSVESNYTADTATANIVMADASLDKSVVTPVSKDLNIGETVIYNLRVTVPAETVLYDAVIKDVVHKDGLQYIPNSAVITNVSGSPDTGAILDGDAVVDTTIPNPGSTLTFNFAGDIDNANDGNTNGDTNYVFDIQYQMLVTALDDNDNEISMGSVNNTATLQWSDSNGGVLNHNKIDNDTVTVLEPNLTINKSVDDGFTVANDTITYTVILSNTGNGILHDIHWTDALSSDIFDAGNSPTLMSVIHSVDGSLVEGVDFVSNFDINPVSIDFTSGTGGVTNLGPGENIIITYKAIVKDTVVDGLYITNSAEVTGDTVSGDNSRQRVYSDSDSATVIVAKTAIGDFVWDDANANGVQDPGENGLIDVIVRLLDAAGNPVDDPSNPGNPYEVTTDANGSYVFDNINPGNCQVEFVLPINYHFSPVNSGGDDTVDSDANLTTGRTQVVPIAYGDGNATLDAGMYKLTSVGGRVWRDDERNGIRADWESAVEGVIVELLDVAGNPVDDPSNPGTPYTVTTGPDGLYNFTNLVPGDYQIRFTQPTDYNPSDKDQGGMILGTVMLIQQL